MAKHTPMKGSAIRHLATSRRGDRIAAAEFESVVSIWSLATQTKQAEFETVLDFGGRRLAIDEGGKRCVAGAYLIHGIACYDTTTGKLLWQRKDLKKVQEIVILPSQNEVACGFEGGSLQILSMRNGTTLQKIRGCRRLRLSPYEPVQLADKKDPVLETFDGSRIATLERESFAILSSVFGHGAVAISESDGPIRCIQTSSGELLWRHKSRKGSHALILGYDEERRRFLGAEWPFQKGGRMTLLRFDPNGRVEAKFPLESSHVDAFCLSGTCLVNSSGQLRDTRTGKLRSQFDFPMKDYPS